MPALWQKEEIALGWEIEIAGALSFLSDEFDEADFGRERIVKNLIPQIVNEKKRVLLNPHFNDMFKQMERLMLDLKDFDFF